MEQSETISGIITRNSRHVSQQDLDLGKCGGTFVGWRGQAEENGREVDYRICSFRGSGVADFVDSMRLRGGHRVTVYPRCQT